MPDSPKAPRRSGASITRRSFLKRASAATTVAGGGLLSQSLLPPSLLRQLAQAGPAGSIDDIEHVIFLMQENRSFDHYYGTLRGVQGFDDQTVLPQRSGGAVFEQRDGDDSVLPFSIRKAAGRQSMNAENVDALNHDWDGGTAALNDGWCDNWIPAKTATTMAYYDREDLPFRYELADAFTVCDQYICSVPTSTSPNRNYFFSGYTGYEPGSPSERAVHNRAYDKGHYGYEWPCLAEILTDAGIDWQVYQEWDNFTDKNLEYFRFTKNVSEQVFSGFSDMGEKYYAELQEAEEAGDSEKTEELTATLTKKLTSLSDQDRKIFDRARYRSEPGTLTDRLADDIANGTLPPVSWLVPPSWESEHPSSSSPKAATNFIYRVLDALGNKPEMWQKTALIITFDENDGYFDHVATPRPPKSETDERYQGTALGFGNRVPTVIVSPWTVGGYRCSEVFDHTSASQFLEKWKGITVNKMSAWRRRISGDLTSAFDFTNPRTFSPVGRPDPSEEREPRWLPEPPSESAMPSQESGTRPQRPLPYQVSVSARPMQDNDAVRLRLKNQGPATANLLVFPFHDLDGAVTGHDVLGEVVVDVPVATGDGHYDITLTGPAGFREDVRGSLKDTGSGSEEGSTAGSVTGSVVGSH